MTLLQSAKALIAHVLLILVRLFLLMVIAFAIGLLGLFVAVALDLGKLEPAVIAAIAIPSALISAGFAWAIKLWCEDWITRIVTAIICLVFPALLGGPGILFFSCLIFRECL